MGKYGTDTHIFKSVTYDYFLLTVRLMAKSVNGSSPTITPIIWALWQRGQMEDSCEKVSKKVPKGLSQ